MITEFQEKLQGDRLIWDECATVYEDRIVDGHPDILNYELMEERFLDELLQYLAKKQNRPIRLMDIGCGSGRLHLRYGTMINKILSEGSKTKALLAERLDEIWGIDFSEKMLRLAQQKLDDASIIVGPKLSLEQGSAFDLKPESDAALPLAICLVNSIGVMQGPSGAGKLFKALRRSVEQANGIAIISCFQQEYVAKYALGQYESTLDVSGQPCWLQPETYASTQYTQKARNYKLAGDPDEELTVDVFDRTGTLVKQGHRLKRDPRLVEQVIKTGDIRTFHDYRSQWYSYGLMDEWMQAAWGENGIHFKTSKIDPEKAEHGQFICFDPAGLLRSFLDQRGSS